MVFGEPEIAFKIKEQWKIEENGVKPCKRQNIFEKRLLATKI